MICICQIFRKLPKSTFFLSSKYFFSSQVKNYFQIVFLKKADTNQNKQSNQSMVHFTQKRNSATTLLVLIFVMKSDKVKKVFFWKLDDYKLKYTLKSLWCQNMMHFTLIIKSVTTSRTMTCSTELKKSFFFHIISLHCIIVGYEDD